ncbi:MAG: hypothetical protein PSX37_13980 [bacterium]|nr:hypothetical protein [bacterium]
MADPLASPPGAKPPPPPPGGAAAATWNGHRWVAGALVWDGTAWAVPGSDPAVTTVAPTRLRFVDKALLFCLILAGALLVGAAWAGVQRWFWGSDDGSSGSSATFTACLLGAAVLLSVSGLLAVVRVMTSRRNG